jgi:SAM-dependent methyltransferase
MKSAGDNMDSKKEDYNTYTNHARYWDWSGYDRTPEDRYWYNYARKYGNTVLSPMCALGETGAYMARHGLTVTAFDITPEMIAEGKKRFTDVQGLKLFVGDVTDFRFDIVPVDFCFSADFEMLPCIEDVKKAFTCINHHMRRGGGLIIDALLPPKESSAWPLETYMPFKKVYPDRKVWKTGSGHNDAETGRRTISQTFYIEHDDDGRLESFDHSFYMQCYSHEEWLNAFQECGFNVVGEYKNRELESWKSGSDDFIMFEAVKHS